MRVDGKAYSGIGNREPMRRHPESDAAGVGGYANEAVIAIAEILNALPPLREVLADYPRNGGLSGVRRNHSSGVQGRAELCNNNAAWGRRGRCLNISRENKGRDGKLVGA